MKDDPMVLALDLARVTGVAWGIPGQVPRSLSWTCAPAGSSHGAIGAGLFMHLRDFLKVTPVDALFFEAPMDARHMGGKTTIDTIEVLTGLAFLAQVVCHMRGIYYQRKVMIADWRSHFLGPGRWNRETAKAAAKARCRTFGWKFTDDNAAEALGVWAFASAIIAPKAAIATAPLFAPRVADVFPEREAANGSSRRSGAGRRAYADVPDMEF